MSRSGWAMLFIVILLAVVLLGCGAFFNKVYDCNQQGGEMMRKMNGTYTCVVD